MTDKIIEAIVERKPQALETVLRTLARAGVKAKTVDAARPHNYNAALPLRGVMLAYGSAPCAYAPEWKYWRLDSGDGKTVMVGIGPHNGEELVVVNTLEWDTTNCTEADYPECAEEYGECSCDSDDDCWCDNECECTACTYGGMGCAHHGVIHLSNNQNLIRL